jgi:hypothetical protein
MKSVQTIAVAAVVASSFTPVLASDGILQLDLTKPKPKFVKPSSISKQQKNNVPAPIYNLQNSGFYSLNITVGTPPQPVSVLLDTGSSDLWLPQAYSSICKYDTYDCELGGSFDPQASSSFHTTNVDFYITYGDGSEVEGTFGYDSIGFGNANLTKVPFAVANDGDVAGGVVGILGIGYNLGEANVQLSSDPQAADTYPNVVSQLKSQGFTNTLAYSLWLNDPDASTGSILFGGVDTDKFTGPLVTVPVQKDEVGTYSRLAVAWTSLSFAAQGKTAQYTPDSFAAYALLDSGTTLTILPDVLMDEMLRSLNADISNGDGYYTLPCSAGDDPDAKFTFQFGGKSGATIDVPLSMVLLPLYDDSDSFDGYGSSSDICLLELIGGAPEGLVILGDAFLRAAYVVYDLENNEISLAQTKFNVTTSNVVEIAAGKEVPSASAVATTVTVSQAAVSTIDPYATYDPFASTEDGVGGLTQTSFPTASAPGFTNTVEFTFTTRTSQPTNTFFAGGPDATGGFGSGGSGSDGSGSGGSGSGGSGSGELGGGPSGRSAAAGLSIPQSILGIFVFLTGIMAIML